MFKLKMLIKEREFLLAVFYDRRAGNIRDAIQLRLDELNVLITIEKGR